HGDPLDHHIVKGGNRQRTCDGYSVFCVHYSQRIPSHGYEILVYAREPCVQVDLGVSGRIEVGRKGNTHGADRTDVEPADGRLSSDKELVKEGNGGRAAGSALLLDCTICLNILFQ